MESPLPPATKHHPRVSLPTPLTRPLHPGRGRFRSRGGLGITTTSRAPRANWNCGSTSRAPGPAGKCVGAGPSARAHTYTVAPSRARLAATGWIYGSTGRGEGGEGGGCRRDGRGQRSASSRGGHGAGLGGRGPQPGLQAAERRGKAGPGAGGAAPPRPAAGPLCRPGRAGGRESRRRPRPVVRTRWSGRARGGARHGTAAGPRDRAQQPGRTCRRDKGRAGPGNSLRCSFPPVAGRLQSCQRFL